MIHLPIPHYSLKVLDMACLVLGHIQNWRVNKWEDSWIYRFRNPDQWNGFDWEKDVDNILWLSQHSGDFLRADCTPAQYWLETFGFEHPPASMFAEGAIFAVKAKTIRMRPREFYENLLMRFTRLNHVNPEIGHFQEKFWGEIFSGAIWLVSKYNIDCGLGGLDDETDDRVTHIEWCSRMKITIWYFQPQHGWCSKSSAWLLSLLLALKDVNRDILIEEDAKVNWVTACRTGKYLRVAHWWIL